MGIEYDGKFAERAKNAVLASGLERLVEIVWGDALETDFSSATVVFIYLVPAGLRQLSAKLHVALDRGARILSYIFQIPDMVPVSTVQAKGVNVYFYQRR